MRTHPLLLAGLAAALPAQSVQPPFNAAYHAVDLGAVPGTGNYGGITFRYDDPDVLLFGSYGSTRIVAVRVQRDAQGYIVGFGSPAVHATVGGVDGGLAYGPGNVLFHTWYGPNQLGQIKPGSTVDDRVIQLAPLGVAGSVGSCAFTPPSHPSPGRLKLVSYHSSTWYEATLAPDGNGTYSITAVSPGIVLQGNPEGILYPPANAPMLGGDHTVLVAEWGGPGVVAYATDGRGDPLPATRQVVMTGLGANGGGAVDPVTGEMLITGGGGRLVALRLGAACGGAAGYGVGTAGLNGVPTLQATGCPRLGGTLNLAVAGGRPLAPGMLLLGDFAAAYTVLGVQVATNNRLVVPHALSSTGTFALPLAIPADPGLGDEHVYLQAVYLDAAAAFGVSATAGLDVYIR